MSRDRDNRPTATLAEALETIQPTETVIETVTEAVTVQSAAPTAEPVLVDDAAHTETLADKLKASNGLTADELFSAVIFQAVDKDVYKSDDGKRYSRKVAKVAAELAGSGFYLAGAISQVQDVNEPHPHYELAWHYSRDSRSSAISYPEGGSKKAEMDAWKDKTIEQYVAWTVRTGIIPGQPTKAAPKHIITGTNLIGATVAAPKVAPVAAK